MMWLFAETPNEMWLLASDQLATPGPGLREKSVKLKEMFIKNSAGIFVEKTLSPTHDSFNKMAQLVTSPGNSSVSSTEAWNLHNYH